MVTKAEKLEKAAKLDLESAYRSVDFHWQLLLELGKVNKENAYQVMRHLDHLANQHQQIALKHWRRGERSETLEQVAKILSADRDAASVAKSYRFRPKINHGWAAFGRAAIFSYLLEGEFDLVLLGLCRFTAPEDITRQNVLRVIDMHLAKCLSKGRADNSLREFVAKYYRSPQVRIARHSYIGYANLIDAINKQDHEQILSAIEVCEKNYLDRANDLSYSSFDLGEGTARFNAQEVDYRLAAILKMLHAKIPQLKRKVTSLHQWRFDSTRSTKQRPIESYLQRLEDLPTDPNPPKKRKKLRGVPKPSHEGLVGVSPSGEFLAISQGPGLSVWKVANYEKLFEIKESGWRLVSCDWKEDPIQMVTLEKNIKPGVVKPGDLNARITWYDANSGAAVRSDPLNATLCSLDRIVCSPDGKLLAMWNGKGIAAVVDSMSCRTLRQWKTGKHAHSLKWSPDCLQLFLGGSHFVTCFALDSSKPIWRARSAQYVVPVTVSSDGRYVAFGSGNKIRVVNAKNGKSVMQFDADCISIVSISFSPQVDRLFVVEEQRRNTFRNELFARTIELATGATHEPEKVGSSTIGFARKADLLFVDRDYELITASKAL